MRVIGRVLQLLHKGFRLAFLMSRPQDMPGDQSTVLLSVSLAIFSYVITGGYFVGFGRAIPLALLDIGLVALVASIALNLAGKPERFNQVLISYAMASIYLNLMSVVLLSSAGDTTAQAGDDPIAAVAGFVYLVWSLSVVGHIVRHAFDTRFAVSIAAAFGFFMLSVSVAGFFFPSLSG